MKLLFVLFLGVVLSTAQDSSVKEFTTGNRLFSAELFTQILLGNTANLVISPYSIETLLAIVQSGAKDETSDEIRSGLYFPNSQKATEEAMKYLTTAVQGDFSTIATLNRISTDGTISINEDFKERATEVYQANFQSTEPNGLGTRASASKVTLVNNLALAASWGTAFSYTNRSKFYTSPQYTINVNTMYETAEYNYYESVELDAKFLEVPFKEEGGSLTVVLPNELDGLGSLEKRVAEVLAAPQYTRTTVQVQLPQFRISSIMDTKTLLQRLGVSKVFQAGEADLSGIVGDKGDLYIGDIQQEIDIDITRSLAGGGADGEIDEYRLPAAGSSFIADHPYMFYVTIRDVIVFIGRVLEPR